MALGLLGTKVGMTQVFTDDGRVEPVTVIELGPCPVLQIRTVDRDGYSAVQVGFRNKPRKNAIRAEQGHVAANLSSKRKANREKAGVKSPPKADCEPQRFIREFRLNNSHDVQGDAGAMTMKAHYIEEEKKDNKVIKHDRTRDIAIKVGDVLNIEKVFEKITAVDVVGQTKGRGYSGVMKRWNFDGMPAAHGSKKNHRQPGSTSSLASNRGSGRPKKGRKLAGQYGNERVTIRNLSIVKIDAENNLMLVRGAVPGFNGAYVMVKPTNIK
jgi:large subunit ribosomal protein L3